MFRELCSLCMNNTYEKVSMIRNVMIVHKCVLELSLMYILKAYQWNEKTLRGRVEHRAWGWCGDCQDNNATYQINSTQVPIQKTHTQKKGPNSDLYHPFPRSLQILKKQTTIYSSSQLHSGPSQLTTKYKKKYHY